MPGCHLAAAESHISPFRLVFLVIFPVLTMLIQDGGVGGDTFPPCMPVPFKRWCVVFFLNKALNFITFGSSSCSGQSQKITHSPTVMWGEMKSLSHWISRAHQLFVLSMHFKALLVPRWITFNQRWATEAWVLCSCSVAPQGRRKAWSTHLNQVFLASGLMQQDEQDFALNSAPSAPPTTTPIALTSCFLESHVVALLLEPNMAAKHLICKGQSPPFVTPPRSYRTNNIIMQMEVTRVVFVAKTSDVTALEVPGRSGNQYGNVALCLWAHLLQAKKCSCLNTSEKKPTKWPSWNRPLWDTLF